jgi:glycosyltransferase involved in cell wall biosynthesis
MIVRDAADTLLTTLASVAPVADELRIVDTGSRDATLDVIRQFSAHSAAPVHLRQVEWPDDFSAARNLSVADAQGDWILWIDADERLIGGELVLRLVQTDHWEAYAIRQHNHLFDGGLTQVEIPFRLFRNGRGYRFYGAVHEHPERELNVTIEPWIVAPGVDILHYGYLVEPTRRRKLLGRNLRLLNLEFTKYPGRDLTDVLYLRDCVNLARFDLQAGRPVRPDHRASLEIALDRFEGRYFAERGRYHDLGRQYYDQGLEILGEGHELAVQVGGAGGTRRTHRFRRMDDALWITGLTASEHAARVGAPR